MESTHMLRSESSESRSPLRLGVLISGGGTTLENLVARIGREELTNTTINVVISSRRAVRGVQIAQDAELRLQIIRKVDYRDEAAFSDAMTSAIDESGVDLVVMGGFLCFWRIPDRWLGRVINIHPSLLPQFGGKGMHGMAVHRAVLAAGEDESGCTVHLVDNEYDHGPIIAQSRVPVCEGDTPESLAARVGEAERELYPGVIQQIADNGVEWLDAYWSGGR